MGFRRIFLKAGSASILAIGLFLLQTKTAHAAIWGAVAKGLLGGLLGLGGKAASAAATVAGIYGVVILLLHLITSLLFLLANSLINTALNFNEQITGVGFVAGGHQIVLGIANMGFIVALVVIAFGTMFRSDAFGYKRALPRLILAALLINFGFFIVTNAFIKPVNLVTQSLREAANFGSQFSAGKILDPRGAFNDLTASGNLSNIDSSLGQAPAITDTTPGIEPVPGGGPIGGPTGVYSITDEPPEFFANWKIETSLFSGTIKGSSPERNDIPGVPAFAEKIAVWLAGTLLGAVFALLGVLALFAFAAMLFIRGLALAFLIILMPLAWAGLIFPNLRIPGGGNPWTTWWENFTRWLLFAPFAMFFFFLAIRLTEEGGVAALAPGSDIAASVGQMLIVIGLILGGLIVSNRMGITGSGYALALAGRGKVWLQLQGKQLGLKAGYGAFKGVKGYEGSQKLSEVGAGRGLFGKALTAPVRAMGRQGIRATAKAEQARQSYLQSRFEGMAPYMVADMYKGLGDEEKMAAAHYMVDRGYQWELPEEWLTDMARWSREGLFEKRGRKKLELDAFDKGYSAEVLATTEELVNAKEAARKREPKLSEEEIEAAIDIRELQDKVDAAWEKTIKILGHRGVPNVDPRIVSGEMKGLQAKFGDAYRRGFIRSTEEHLPTAMNALFSRSRGGGATFIVDEVERGIEQWDKDFLVPFVMQRDKLSVEAATTKVGGMEQKEKVELVTKNWGEIWPAQSPRAQRTLERLSREIGRIEMDPKISERRKEEMTQALENEKRRIGELGPHQAVTAINSLYTAGKRAYFFPFVGGETASTPPTQPA